MFVFFNKVKGWLVDFFTGNTEGFLNRLRGMAAKINPFKNRSDDYKINPSLRNTDNNIKDSNKNKIKEQQEKIIKQNEERIKIEKEKMELKQINHRDNIQKKDEELEELRDIKRTNRQIEEDLNPNSIFNNRDGPGLC